MMTRTEIHRDAMLRHLGAWLIWDVDGVVDVISRVNQAPAPQHATVAGDRGESPQ
jgi:hypothetical protein